MALSTVGSAVQAMESTHAQSSHATSQQWNRLMQDLQKHGGKAVREHIQKDEITKALQRSFNQRSAENPSLETPFLDSALMQPIFKDSSMPQSPLSVKDFLVKAINRMQAQQPSTHSENGVNGLMTQKIYVADCVQSLLNKTAYEPNCEYRINMSVDDKGLQEILDKINAFPAGTDHLPVQPIVLDEKENAWLNPPDNTFCKHKQSRIDNKTCNEDMCVLQRKIQGPLNELTASGTARAKFKKVKGVIDKALREGLPTEDFPTVYALCNKIERGLSAPQDWPLTHEERAYIAQCAQINPSGEAFWKITHPILDVFTGQQGKVVPIPVFVPCAKGILPVYDLARSMLDNVHLVGWSKNQSPPWHTDEIEKWTRTGFAMHDMGHALATSSIIDPIVKQAMVDVLNTARTEKDKKTMIALFWTLHERNLQGLSGNTANTDYFMGHVYRDVAKDLENGDAVDMNKERTGPLGRAYTLQGLLAQKIAPPLSSVLKERMDELKDCINGRHCLDDLAQGARSGDMLAHVQRKAENYRIDSESYVNAIFNPLIDGHDEIDDGGELRNLMKYARGNDWKEKGNWQYLQDDTTTLRDKVIRKITNHIQPPSTDGDTVTS